MVWILYDHYYGTMVYISWADLLQGSFFIRCSLYLRIHGKKIVAEGMFIMKKIIVIGASASAIGFIAKVRSFDQESQILCFSGESHIPYNRCLLADVLQEDKALSDIQLKPDTFFEDNRVDLRLNSWVTEINREQKYILCAGKQEFYDYLFIGIGTHAFVPSIPGVKLPGVFAFHTFSDITRLDDFIHQQMPKHALVIGAGINGIEAASALISKGLKVTVVDLYDTVMPLHLDKQAADYIESAMKKAGVMVMKGQKVVALHTRNKESVGRVQFESGACIATDCVVFATGSRPNSTLITQAGLHTVQGGFLAVNEKMQTSDPFIFAGGDICCAPDIVSKSLVRSATWSDAMLQGLIAATQLSTTPRLYPGVIGMRDSKFFGLDFYACGQTVNVQDYDAVVRTDKDYFHAFYLFDGKLQGFVLLGDISNLAKYRTLYVMQSNVIEGDL